MKKFYVIFPVIGVVVFALFFWRFNAEFDTNEKAKQHEKAVEIEKKRALDFEAKRKAMEEAIAQQEKRKEERAAREKRDTEEKQQQQDLRDAADKARDEAQRIGRQADLKKVEIGVEVDLLKKLATEKTNLLAEDEFLLKYVKNADENQKSLEALMTKIDQVDKATALAVAQTAKKK